jgi:hypothetical protein
MDFFRTMVPDLTSMATTRTALLLQELRDSGMPDPVVVMRERFDREHPDDIMFEPRRGNGDDDDDE